jgi:uncharacterized hydrophobic protein (TIGR00341 family)
MIPAGKQETVVSVLEDEGIDYVLSDETSGREYTAVASFPLPTGAVEPILERLREAGLERDAYTVVLNAETVVSDRFDRLLAEYESDEEKDEDRIAREELAARAEEMAPETFNYAVLAIISAVVATAGLLLDSPAVVVGSMVIAPLLGPAMATSVGTVVDDRELFRRGVRLQVLGGVLAMGSAAVFAGFLRETGIVPLSASEVFSMSEVTERLSPDLLALPIALGAGIAGALSLSAGVSAALVGVMIAAALVPPTAVVGIGIAWGRPEAVVGAGILVVVNYLSINMTALGTLWYRGYRPDGLFSFNTTESITRRRMISLLVAVLAVSSVLAGVTFAGAQAEAFESTATAETVELLDGESGTLQQLHVTYEGVLFRHPTSVTVTVGISPDADPPQIAAELAARLAVAAKERFGGLPAYPERQTEGVTVQVEFVTVEEAHAA